MPMMMGMNSWWILALMGMPFVAVVALVGAYPLFAHTKRPSLNQREREPLSIVRERYARGEISHKELDQLVETIVRREPPA